jgi:hypothetical protein
MHAVISYDYDGKAAFNCTIPDNYPKRKCCVREPILLIKTLSGAKIKSLYSTRKGVLI